MKKPNALKNILFGIGMLIIIPIFFGVLFSGKIQFRTIPVFFKQSAFGMTVGVTMWLGNWAISAIIGKKLPWKKNPERANRASMFLFLSFGLITAILLSYVFEHFIYGQTGRQLYENTIINSFIALAIDLIFISIFYPAYMAKYYRESLEQNEKLKHENLKAKYESLKNQVNPHFLFNSLNTLTGIVEQKPELATDYIKKLSDIYRYVLEQSDKEIVSITDELDFITDYIYLSKLRFGEALQYKENIEDKINTGVIPLGLQLLVENAIKHNIISDKSPLKIELFQDDGFFVVRNNLNKKKNVIRPGKPLGLENLKNRYTFLTEETPQIVESTNEFIVKLPMLKKD